MRLSISLSTKRATAALALAGMASAFPGLAAGQSQDSTWTPKTYDLRGGTAAKGAATTAAPTVQAPVQVPVAKQAVEKDGSAAFQKAGDHSFTIPDYTTIAFVVDGAGGSAARPVTVMAENPTRYAPDFGTPGSAGGDTFLGNLGMAGSGGGGGNGVTAIYRGGCFPRCQVPYPYSTIGNDSVTMTFYRGDDGGAGGGDANMPGGAKNGGAPTEAGGRNGGGNGGRAIKAFTKGQPGAPVPGQVFSLHVGAGGEPAVVTEPMKLSGMTTKPGNDGAVYVNWKFLAYQ
jgi:hypothetical protein